MAVYQYGSTHTHTYIVKVSSAEMHRTPEVHKNVRKPRFSSARIMARCMPSAQMNHDVPVCLKTAQHVGHHLFESRLHRPVRQVSLVLTAPR